MEFTIAQIRDFAGDEQTFEKGEKLMKEKAIKSLDIDDFSSPEIIMVNANVVDKKVYREVNMSIDKDDFIVRAHLCGCEEHAQKMTCAHCVAVLLRLMEDSKRKNAEKEQMENKVVDKHAIQIMNIYEEQIVYSSLAMNLKTAIHLEPVLEIRKKNILALTLKIGNEKQYIVKDIALFLDDIAHNVKKSLW